MIFGREVVFIVKYNNKQKKVLIMDYRKILAEKRKANKFAKSYLKEHGELPSVEAITEAKELTAAEVAKLELNAEISELSNGASWDYIWNEETWNASYENGVLKDYYVWADGLSPYKEDLWNTVELRPANWNDIEKDGQGNPIEYEDGYHYINCVRCWLGAVNAPGAQYPWCGVRINPFEGIIKWDYKGQVAYPWGEEKRVFKRTFAVASIPAELGEQYKLVNGVTTFEPEHLKVTLI